MMQFYKGNSVIKLVKFKLKHTFDFTKNEINNGHYSFSQALSKEVENYTRMTRMKFLRHN